MKKLVFVVIIALLMFGCKSKQNAVVAYQGDVEVFTPCSGADYRTDKNNFRAASMGFSNDMNIAKSKALQNARAELATSINATIKRVVDNYSSSYQLGEQEEAKSKFQDLSRTVVNQQLNGTVVICEKMMKTPEGAYRCYIAVELGSPEVIEKINNSVASEGKLRIDYEYEKFKKVFEEEMSKM